MRGVDNFTFEYSQPSIESLFSNLREEEERPNPYKHSNNFPSNKKMGL